MSHGILVVEDEATLAKNIKRYLERHDYEVRIAATGDKAVEEFEAFKPDMVLLDYNLPGPNGVQVLERIHKTDAHVKVIMLTGHGNVQIAVDAMKAGAYDYLTKPVDMGELKLLIDKAVGQERLEGALSYYRDKEAGESGLAKIIGESPPIVGLRGRIAQLLKAERKLGDEDHPAVLITGETGTGKELVARALHFDGSRKDHPFVEINSASIPSHLLESELFGYERGAFTDAHRRKLGLVESAHGGTLFLDEIGDIDAAVQAKLLKLIESKIVRRLGSVRDRRVNVRIVTATNRLLEQLVQDGSFRSDLFYRLSVVNLKTPPLRECGDDIVRLGEYYLGLHGRRYAQTGLQFSAAARDTLASHSWPGNVRELRNVVEQAVLMSPGDVIEPEHLSVYPAHGYAGATASNNKASSPVAPLPAEGIKLAEVERDLIVKTLESATWNVTRAAKLLGMSRDTLRYRMEKHGLRPPS